MLTTRWKPAEVTYPGGVTVIAGRLPLRSLRAAPAVLGWTWRIRRELDAAAGYSLGWELSGPALWMVSAWHSRGALTAFEHTAAHEQAKAALRPGLRPPTFVVWSCSGADLPVPWPEVRRRIAAAADR